MSNYFIDIQVTVGDGETLEPLCEQAAQATLTHQRVTENGTLTILITDDAELQRLNASYRDEDKPTDVLSFEDGTEWPDGQLYLGDIAISLETAERQATAGGHPLLDEMALLAVHGVLHLLGYDHGEPEEKAAMWQAQAEILDELGISIQPTE